MSLLKSLKSQGLLFINILSLRPNKHWMMRDVYYVDTVADKEKSALILSLVHFSLRCKPAQTSQHHNYANTVSIFQSSAASAAGRKYLKAVITRLCNH